MQVLECCVVEIWESSSCRDVTAVQQEGGIKDNSDGLVVAVEAPWAPCMWILSCRSRALWWSTVGSETQTKKKSDSITKPHFMAISFIEQEQANSKDITVNIKGNCRTIRAQTISNSDFMHNHIMYCSTMISTIIIVILSVFHNECFFWRHTLYAMIYMRPFWFPLCLDCSLRKWQYLMLNLQIQRSQRISFTKIWFYVHTFPLRPHKTAFSRSHAPDELTVPTNDHLLFQF